MIATAPSETDDPERIARYREESDAEEGYLDFASFGPLLRGTAAARREADEITTTHAHDVGRLADTQRDLLDALAALTGFPARDIAFSPNTSLALFQAAFAAPAGTVLVSPFDFPANVEPWLRAQEMLEGHGVTWLSDPDGPRAPATPALVASRLTKSTRVVSVSAVDYATGDVVDLAGIREVIGERLLIVDAIQGMGVADLPWQCADVVCAGGQKWLRGGWSTGFLACSQRALDQLGSGLSGWSGMAGSDDPRALQTHRSPQPGAGRFSVTAPDLVALHGFHAAIRAIMHVGPHTIYRHVAELSTRLRSELVGIHAQVSGADAGIGRSGITSFTVPGVAPARIVSALRGEGLYASERAGCVRVSVHASTTWAVLDRLVRNVERLT